MLDQMPFLRKKYLRYAQYSTAKIEDIFTPEQLNTAQHFKAENMYSCVFINDGKGNFSQKNLPVQAQFFPVNAIQTIDINNDKILDLLLSGNNYSTEVETGRCDAGVGLLLLGKKEGNYEPVPSYISNFYTPGDVKCMQKIIIGKLPYFIIGKNKDSLQLVRPN